MKNKKSDTLSPIKEGTCPNCNTELKFSLEDRREGERIECPKCGENFSILEVNITKKKGKLKLIIYSIVGLFGISLFALSPWFSMGIIVAFLIYKFYNPQGDSRKWKIPLIIVVVLIGASVNTMVGSLNEEPGAQSEFVKKEEREERTTEAESLLEEAKKKVDEEDIEGAFGLLDKAIETHPSGSFNQAIYMKKDLISAQSEDFLKESLGSLTGEEFNLLVSGELEKEFLKDETVNRYFSKILKKNLDKREEYYTEIQAKKAAEEAARIEEEKLRAEEERLEKINAQFSAWDGSHIELKNYIKQTMNDPKSFDHVETLYSDKGDYIVVQMTFRGKNSFGGLVLNSVTANILVEDSSAIEIIDYSY